MSVTAISDLPWSRFCVLGPDPPPGREGEGQPPGGFHGTLQTLQRPTDGPHFPSGCVTVLSLLHASGQL